MVWSPLSQETPIGRMPIYILTLALFVVLQVPVALTTNYGNLMAFRFLPVSSAPRSSRRAA